MPRCGVEGGTLGSGSLMRGSSPTRRRRERGGLAGDWSGEVWKALWRRRELYRLANLVPAGAGTNGRTSRY